MINTPTEGSYCWQSLARYSHKFFCLFFSLAFNAAVNTHAASQKAAILVGKWDRVECAVTNTVAYKDPYRDVTLEAEFNRPET